MESLLGTGCRAVPLIFGFGVLLVGVAITADGLFGLSFGMPVREASGSPLLGALVAWRFLPFGSSSGLPTFASAAGDYFQLPMWTRLADLHVVLNVDPETAIK